jgi:hypothetical protein
MLHYIRMFTHQHDVGGIFNDQRPNKQPFGLCYNTGIDDYHIYTSC